MKTLLLLFILFLASCNPNVKIDSVMAAYDAGDFTAIIQGCGNQPIVGYTYCRKQEGDAAGELITFIGPPVDCDGDGPCIFYKVYFPDGREPLGGSIKRGETQASVQWTQLIAKNTFDKGDRGFYPVVYTISWLDSDKKQRRTVVEGEIRLRVYSKGYIPLNNVSSDPNFTFEWTQGPKIIKITTGGRAYVGNK